MEETSKIYSHSRLWLFESCPEAYKIKYIDKTFPELPKSAELFLGDIVHQTLEWLYKNKEPDKIGLDDLIKNFAETWNECFAENIRFTGPSENYFNKGIKFLIDYYKKNFPFKENTIEVEKRILFPLDENKEYQIQGYIDRIVMKDGFYEVHDYKTNENMKTQEQVDSDRQLAFYHLGLQELFGKQIKVKLIWHFLAHNKTIISERNEDQLNELKLNTLKLIKNIESNSNWSSCGRRWCDWCAYKSSLSNQKHNKLNSGKNLSNWMKG